jgi:hypothetical protein
VVSPLTRWTGIAGEAGVRDYSYQSRIFVGLVLILIFAEVLGLYGLIVSLILNTKANQTKWVSEPWFKSFSRMQRLTSSSLLGAST